MAAPAVIGGAAGLQAIGNLAGKQAADRRNAQLDQKTNPIEQALPGLAQMMMNNPAIAQLGGLAGMAMNNPAIAQLGNLAGMATGALQGLGDNDPLAQQYRPLVNDQIGRLNQLYGQATDTSLMEKAADRAMFKAGQALRGQFGGSSLLATNLANASQDIYTGLARDIAQSQMQDRAFRAGLTGQIADFGGALMQDALGRRGALLQGLSNASGIYGTMGNLWNQGLGNAADIYGVMGNMYQGGLGNAAGLYGNLLQYYGGQRPNFQPNWNFSGLATAAAGIK